MERAQLRYCSVSEAEAAAAEEHSHHDLYFASLHAYQTTHYFYDSVHLI